MAWQCDKDGMDEKVAGCMDSMDERVSVLEQAVLSGEGESQVIVFNQMRLRRNTRIGFDDKSCGSKSCIAKQYIFAVKE